MASILNKFKTFAIGVIVVSFFMGVTLNSCTSKNKKSENTEKVEAASESEHPSGTEHPADSTKQEHPAN